MSSFSHFLITSISSSELMFFVVYLTLNIREHLLSECLFCNVWVFLEGILFSCSANFSVYLVLSDQYIIKKIMKNISIEPIYVFPIPYLPCFPTSTSRHHPKELFYNWLILGPGYFGWVKSSGDTLQEAKMFKGILIVKLT